MIIVSEQMFDRIMARAQEVAEEQFRRMVFDTGMRAEAVALLHDRVVDRLAERYVEDLARRAGDQAEETRL
jgi:predicted subunit of tRNA(5-methylaminomethyl-2-thiouridylate) methyltransferase